MPGQVARAAGDTAATEITCVNAFALPDNIDGRPFAEINAT